MVTLAPFIPALLPLATLIWLRVLHDTVPIARNDFLSEYDFIVGKLFLAENLQFIIFNCFIIQ